MIEFGSMALMRPWWLIAAIAIAVFAYLAREAKALAGWDRAIEPKLLAALRARGAVVAGTNRPSLAQALAAGLIAMALAGPAVERADPGTFRNLDGTVIAIDLSRSVAVGGRLHEALIAARAVVEAAGSRQVALIVYAGDAYLVSPFTTDHAALDTTIFALDGQTVPDPGTRPERALSLARRTFAEANIAQGDVVLISDGGGVAAAASREATALASAGHVLETLFVPAKIAMPESAPRPNRPPLDALAASGHGVAGDVIDFGPVLGEIASRPALRLGRGDYAVLAWRDLGRFLLALAAIPGVLLFRRRS